MDVLQAQLPLQQGGPVTHTSLRKLQEAAWGPQSNNYWYLPGPLQSKVTDTSLRARKGSSHEDVTEQTPNTIILASPPAHTGIHLLQESGSCVGPSSAAPASLAALPTPGFSHTSGPEYC